jgi:hypothetical protein
MIKRYDEMTQVDALKHKYRDGKIPLISYETNRTENVYDALFISSDNSQYLFFFTDEDGYVMI